MGGCGIKKSLQREKVREGRKYSKVGNLEAQAIDNGDSSDFSSSQFSAIR
jgi:hypothetical protein